MSSDATFKTDLEEFLAKARGGVRLPVVVIREFPAYAITTLKLEEVMEVEGMDVDSFVSAIAEAAYEGKINPILARRSPRGSSRSRARRCWCCLLYTSPSPRDS